MESLKSFPLDKIQAALDRLMHEPPKRELTDGTISEYRGRPTLVDVLRTIEIMDEAAAQAAAAKAREEERRKERELGKRREEHPEEFLGVADFFTQLKQDHPELFVAKQNKMPEVRMQSTGNTDKYGLEEKVEVSSMTEAELQNRRMILKQQKQTILKRHNGAKTA